MALYPDELMAVFNRRCNKNPLSGGLLNLINGRHTKPIVGKTLSIFFEKCKHHVDIFGEIIYLVTFLNCSSAYASSCQH
ncbi:hypothetical protein ACLBL6_005716, partial [Escherichia coli]